ELLRTAALRKGIQPPLVLEDEALTATAESTLPSLVPLVQEILGLAERGSYGALLAAVMAFPARLSEALDMPMLVMLDEFQDITRLRQFRDAGNLLGTIRAALDRKSRVGFAVAGSRVTALRNLIGASESPLFTRFQPIEVGPFAQEATTELATLIWDEDGVESDPDASVRLYRLTGGWPLYVQAVAQRARQIARTSTGQVTPEIIDLAFYHELFGRGATMALHCRYLLETATKTDSESRQGILTDVLRQVALRQPLTRVSLVRRLARHHSKSEIHRAVNRLIENDFVSEQEGTLTLLDRIFGLWLSSEPARQNPEALLANQSARQKLLSWYEQRHAEDRQEMGDLFEKRVENLVRQFKGQRVEGRLFASDVDVELPNPRQIIVNMKVYDPKGLYGDGADTYEMDLVILVDDQQESWAVEDKHRKTAITIPMIERFLTTVRVLEKAKGLTFSHFWMVATKGIRSEAQARAKAEGIMVTGVRQLGKLEKLAASGWKTS
ncbi:MAG: ATP-binding protein, partial [Chloroflexota bacterium]